MTERDAASDLSEMSKLFQEPGGAMSLAMFAMDALPHWIREAERLRARVAELCDEVDRLRKELENQKAVSKGLLRDIECNSPRMGG